MIQVGKALGVSILDMTNANPYSRIANSEFHSLNGLRDWLKKVVCHESASTLFKLKAKAKERRKSSDNLQVSEEEEGQSEGLEEEGDVPVEICAPS